MFPLAQPLAISAGMEFGPDGGLWFPQVVTNEITRLDPSTGQMNSYPLPAGAILRSPISAGTLLASDITTGPDGAMWFSMSGTAAVGRIDVVAKQIDIIPAPKPLSTVILATKIIQPGPGNAVVTSLSRPPTRSPRSTRPPARSPSTPSRHSPRCRRA